MDDKLITRSEAARRVGVTEKTLYSWEKRGLVPLPERDARGWRRYSVAQIDAMREYQGRLHPNRGSRKDARSVIPGMGEVSARNRLRGTITSITGDGVLAEVVIDLGHGNEIVSVITRSSVERLDLKVGEQATALMKSTEVLIAR
jgi:molybdopterin-binding protein